MLGTLYIISAPSGAGKSSLINELIKRNPTYDLKVSISHTTRMPRPKEESGVHYHFVDQPVFSNMIEQNDFLEYAQVFDHFYGTSRQWIEENLRNGIDIFLDIDWQGAIQIRKKMPKSVGIFILPPSRKELERRLISRAQDSTEVIAKRMKKASIEISHYDEYDYVIVNDDFDLAIMDIKAIIRAQRLKQEKQAEKYKAMINGLLNESPLH